MLGTLGDAKDLFNRKTDKPPLGFGEDYYFGNDRFNESEPWAAMGTDDRPKIMPDEEIRKQLIAKGIITPASQE